MEPNNTNANDGKEATGTWLVIKNSTGKYICRAEGSEDDVLDALVAGNYVVVKDVLDYETPIQARQDGGGGVQLAKANITTRLDSTLYSVPVRISLKGAVIYFLNDLHDSDALQYKHLIKMAIESAEASVAPRAERASGIVTASKIPPGGPLGHRA